MTSIATHVPPSAGAVARTQIRAARVAMRTEGLVFVGLLAAFLAAIIAGAMHVRGNPNSTMTTEYQPVAMIPVAFAAFFIPLAVWRADDRARRAYLWAMPFGRQNHTLLKVFGGWVWVMAAVVAYLLFIGVASLTTGLITGYWPGYTAAWWEYLIAFTGVTTAYLLGSVFVVGSARPWRWVLLIAVVLTFSAIISGAYNLSWIDHGIASAWSGYAGLTIALWGSMDGRNDPARWLAATAVWMGLGAVLLVYAARRHPER